MTMERTREALRKRGVTVGEQERPRLVSQHGCN